MYIANLSFLLNYDEGESKDEIESELYKVALQSPGTVHYDRLKGGGFDELEQEPLGIATNLKFAANLISSVYYLNSEKGFNPYIVVGYSDIRVDSTSEDYLITVTYTLLSELNLRGQINI